MRRKLPALALAAALAVFIQAPSAHAGREIFQAIEYGYSLDAIAEELGASGEVNSTTGVDRTTPLIAAARKATALNSTRYVIEEDELLGPEGARLARPAPDGDFSRLFRLLASYGADLEAKNKAGDTALMILSRNHELHELSATLISLGANPNATDRNGTPILINSLLSCDHADTAFWLDRGASVSVSDQNGMTPLLHALSSNCSDSALVERLLGRGSEINRPDNNGRTPLLAALQRGNADVAELLLRRGASVRCRDRATGDAPLNAAVRNNQFEMVKLLVSHGADANNADAQGDTPLLAAAYKRNTELAAYLLSNGADPNAKNFFGKSPLSQAVSTCQSDMVSLLLRNGADPAGVHKELKSLDQGGARKCTTEMTHLLASSSTR